MRLIEEEIEPLARLFTIVEQKARQEGAKAERERIAIRQSGTDECPPEYGCHRVKGDCKKCWLDWLEADE